MRANVKTTKKLEEVKIKHAVVLHLVLANLVPVIQVSQFVV